MNSFLDYIDRNNVQLMLTLKYKCEVILNQFNIIMSCTNVTSNLWPLWEFSVSSFCFKYVYMYCGNQFNSRWTRSDHRSQHLQQIIFTLPVCWILPKSLTHFSLDSADWKGKELYFICSHDFSVLQPCMCAMWSFSETATLYGYFIQINNVRCRNNLQRHYCPQFIQENQGAYQY